MEKKELTVYIVEDDKTLAQLLKEAVEVSGFSAKMYFNPSDCISQFRMNPPDFLLVDCLLPQMSGIDLIVELQKVHAGIPTVLMSGIYTDKNFIKDALLKTGAIGFMTKPFKPDALIDKINDTLNDKIDQPVSPIESMYQNASASPNEALQAAQLSPTIHGFHIPKLLFTMMSAKYTGSLHLVHEDKETSQIYFNNGDVIEVKVKDPNSYFGRLMVEKNYLSPEELDMALNLPSQKRIGEKLIDANLISPHIIDMINSEQMCLRLGRLITNSNYEIQFVQEKHETARSRVDANLLQTYFNEWLTSKIATMWVEKFYLPYIENAFALSPVFQTSPLIWSSHILKALPNLSKNIQPGINLQKLLTLYPGHEEDLYNAVHLLTARGLLFFDREIKSEDQVSKLVRVKKLLADHEHQDFFQIMGVTRKAKAAEIKKAYHDLAKIFHPDKLPASATEEMRNLVRQLFSKMTTAYQTLADPKARDEYIKDLENGQAQLRLQAESLFEEAREALRLRQAEKASDLLEKAAALCPPTTEIRLYMLWADLATIDKKKNAQQALQKINTELNRVPPEDRHNATYYFVKGLFQKYIGEVAMARGNLAHAVSLEPNFIEAKRELNVLQLSEDNKPIDLMNADLKDVVGALFKKKK